MSSISVVMIVKDEAEMAPGFIESVKGLWDELVVVDTGSTDGTPELFAAAGAKIVHHRWADDFAEARNVSLAHAHGDWVLVLDADERVSPAFIKAFLSRCEEPTVGALTVRMSNPLPYGHRRDSWILRAWRRDDTVRFRHAIHEDASSDVARMLFTTKRTIERVDAPVEHLGYVRTRAAAKDKKRRDHALLERTLAKEPYDFYAHLKLLELSRFWRDSVLWSESARRAIDALEAKGGDALTGVPWGGELIALVSEGLFRADSAAGLAFLERWEPQLVAGAPFFHRRAQHHEAMGDTARATADFSRCLELGELLGDHQLSTVRPRLGLARLSLMAGRAAEALAHVDEALEVQPRDPEALVAGAALRLQLEGQAGLDAWVSELTRRHGPSPELAWAVGDAALTLGLVDQAIPALRRAAGVPPSGPAALRLAQALLADGQLMPAEQLTRSLLETEPEAGLGVLLFDLLQGRDTALDLDLTPETAHASMRHWVDALIRSRKREWVSQLRQNAAAVGTVFPWLDDYLRRSA
ncbi:MAG: glycosyltransferase [Myxococcaceae bacterium]|nr:glycosyltransferase [Myxococcaceae bacterium]